MDVTDLGLLLLHLQQHFWVFPLHEFLFEKLNLIGHNHFIGFLIHTLGRSKLHTRLANLIYASMVIMMAMAMAIVLSIAVVIVVAMVTVMAMVTGVIIFWGGYKPCSHCSCSDTGITGST